VEDNKKEGSGGGGERCVSYTAEKGGSAEMTEVEPYESPAQVRSCI